MPRHSSQCCIPLSGEPPVQVAKHSLGPPERPRNRPRRSPRAPGDRRAIAGTTRDTMTAMTSPSPAPGVGTAALKLVDRRAGSPTGAWRPGDEPGHRRFVEIGDLPLESGEVLPDTHLAFETWGTPTPERDNAVLVLHALTGDSHVTARRAPATPRPAGGAPWSGPAAPSTPTATSSSQPTSWAGARDRRGPPPSPPMAAPGARASRG